MAQRQSGRGQKTRARRREVADVESNECQSGQQLPPLELDGVTIFLARRVFSDCQLWQTPFHTTGAAEQGHWRATVQPRTSVLQISFRYSARPPPLAGDVARPVSASDFA